MKRQSNKLTKQERQAQNEAILKDNTFKQSFGLNHLFKRIRSMLVRESIILRKNEEKLHEDQKRQSYQHKKDHQQSNEIYKQVKHWEINEKSDWIKVLSNLTSTNVESITSKSKNFQNVLLKEMPKINFSQLKSLHLNENKICNISFLQEMNCLKVQWIQLNENYITDLKSLKKCHFPSLKSLQLRKNLIKQINMNCFFENQNLSRFKLRKEWDRQEIDNNQIENMNIIFKLKGGHFISSRITNKIDKNYVFNYEVNGIIKNQQVIQQNKIRKQFFQIHQHQPFIFIQEKYNKNKDFFKRYSIKQEQDFEESLVLESFEMENFYYEV